MEHYYSELARHELLGADGERELAKEIEAKEIEVWVRLLSSGRHRDRVLAVLADTLPDPVPNIAQLRRAITLAKKPPTGPGGSRGPGGSSKQRGPAHLRRGVDRWVRRTAAALREMDRDRAHLAAVLSALDREPSPGVLFARWRQSVDAAERDATVSRERFVRGNLRLVVTFARKYAGYGIPFEDLVQEGNIGLLRAVDRFDYRRGLKFSTYAGWWIRHWLQRAVANGARTVRVPVHVQDTYRIIVRSMRELQPRLQRTPTNEEIAAHTGISADKVERTRLRASARISSLDEPLRDGGEITRMDLLEDPANDAVSLVDALALSESAASILALLRRLSPVRADVLRKRFGLEGEQPMTLQAIANGYGLSRERVRQIERDALVELRRFVPVSDSAA